MSTESSCLTTSCPITSPQGQTYLSGVKCAANCAWANRRCITHWAREALCQALGRRQEDAGLELVYDVAHNIAKIEEHEVHGFHADKDEAVIEHTAYEIAKRRLKEEGHAVADVHDQTELGYDLKCQGHCAKVFEVKGMSQPRDIPFEESQVKAAQQKKDYILVCIYNLPTHPNKVGYKEIPHPERIWIAVEKARVPKDQWLSV